jgi:hypothetical protein
MSIALRVVTVGLFVLTASDALCQWSYTNDTVQFALAVTKLRGASAVECKYEIGQIALGAIGNETFVGLKRAESPYLIQSDRFPAGADSLYFSRSMTFDDIHKFRGSGHLKEGQADSVARAVAYEYMHKTVSPDPESLTTADHLLYICELHGRQRSVAIDTIDCYVDNRLKLKYRTKPQTTNWRRLWLPNLFNVSDSLYLTVRCEVHAPDPSIAMSAFESSYARNRLNPHKYYVNQYQDVGWLKNRGMIPRKE